MSKTKNYDIQILRAFAIIAVILIHTCPIGLPQALFRPFINFGVALFLFLSGYLTKTHYISWLTFYKRRTTRVLIPYFLWSLIYSIPSLDNPIILFKNLISTNAEGHLYYISVYIQLVLLTPLISILARSRYKVLGWIITPISITLFLYPQFYAGVAMNSHMKQLYTISCFTWFIFYYLGFLLGNHILVKKFNSKHIGILLLCSIIVQILEGYLLLKLGVENCGTQAKISAILTNCLFCILVYTILTRKQLKIRSRFLLSIGNYSFGIYLCHILFIIIAKQFTFYSKMPFILNSIVILILSLLFCYICDKVLNYRLCKWIGIR